MIDILGTILMWGATAASLLLLLPLVLLFTRQKSVEGLCTKLSDFFDNINVSIAQMVMWSVLLMALIQSAIVVMRYVFGLNFIWLQEIVIYLFGALFLLTAGYALLNDDHVRVDIFYRDAPPERKAIIDLVGTYVFLLPVCILIIWAGGPYVARSWRVLEGSTEASGLQIVYVLKTMIPVFAVLLAIAGFSIATQAVKMLLEARSEGS